MDERTQQALAIGFPVVLAIKHQRIADLITTALETPVGDWMQRAVVQHIGGKPVGVDRKSPWYSQGAFWANPGAGLVCDVDKPTDDHSGKKVLILTDFQHALILLATAKDGAYAHHLGDFLACNDDANTADIFMQLAVYGEEVFA